MPHSQLPGTDELGVSHDPQGDTKYVTSVNQGVAIGKQMIWGDQNMRYGQELWIEVARKGQHTCRVSGI